MISIVNYYSYYTVVGIQPPSHQHVTSFYHPPQIIRFHCQTLYDMWSDRCTYFFRWPFRCGKRLGMYRERMFWQPWRLNINAVPCVRRRRRQTVRRWRITHTYYTPSLLHKFANAYTVDCTSNGTSLSRSNAVALAVKCSEHNMYIANEYWGWTAGTTTVEIRVNAPHYDRSTASLYVCVHCTIEWRWNCS